MSLRIPLSKQSKIKSIVSLNESLRAFKCIKTASKTLSSFRTSQPYYLYFALLKIEFWRTTATYSSQTSATTIAVAVSRSDLFKLPGQDIGPIFFLWGPPAWLTRYIQRADSAKPIHKSLDQYTSRILLKTIRYFRNERIWFWHGNLKPFI